MKKLYYSIGEISKMLGEEQHILRHWEKTFPVLKPKKNSSGVRVYSDKDIDVLKAIKILLRDKLTSVKETKDILATGRKAVNEVLKDISPQPLDTNLSYTDSDKSTGNKNTSTNEVSLLINNDQQRESNKDIDSLSKEVDAAQQRDFAASELLEIKSVLLDIKEQLRNIISNEI